MHESDPARLGLISSDLSMGRDLDFLPYRLDCGSVVLAGSTRMRPPARTRNRGSAQSTHRQGTGLLLERKACAVGRPTKLVRAWPG
jgi:hypothetical protein